MTVLSKLDPATKYNIEVYAKIGKSGDKLLLIGETIAQTRPLPPFAINATSTDSTISIEWQSFMENGEYETFCEPIIKTPEIEKLINSGKKVVITIGNKAVCDDLLPAIDYKIGLKSRNPGEMESIVVNVRISTKAPAPAGVIADNVSADKVELTIADPEDGEVEGYLVEINADAGLDASGEPVPVETFTLKIPSTVDGVTVIEDLTPGTNYNVNVIGK